MKRIYLAGPDVFHPDAAERAEAHKALCLQSGFEPCEFQAKLDTDSMATWTVIPTAAGQRFQGTLDSWKR